MPPPRPPVRLRTWIAAAVALAGIWFVNKPADKPASVAEQVEAATALAAQCDLDGARSALAVLKSAKAPAAQIKRLQASITKSAASCDRQQQRAQAWTALQDSVKQALDAGKPELAATRLAIYVKRWGDENSTFGVVKVIQGAKTESVPLGELKKLSEQRKLLFDEQLMQFAMGNCITLVDTNGNRKLYKQRQDQKIDAVAAMHIVACWVRLYQLIGGPCDRV